MKVAMLGLGLMGSRMAGKLLEHRYDLTVWNRSEEKAQPLAARGAKVAASPRAAAAAADVILSCVTADHALREVMLASDGALAAAAPGKIFVDLSTVLPETSREVAEEAARRGAVMIDCPVSGSTPQLEQAAAVLLAGGDAAALDRVRPVLRCFSRAIHHLGPSGAGATMKLCVNILLAFGLQAVAEAAALGLRAGLPRDLFFETLGETAVISPAAKGKLENVSRDRYPEAFGIATMAKDLRLARELATKLGIELPVTHAAEVEYTAATMKHPGADFSVIVRYQAERNDIA